MRTIFYHSTVKKIIVAFATIFDEIKFHDGYGQEIAVPLHYSPRSKFIEQIQSAPDMDQLGYDTVLPRMGFEMVGLNFAPERHLNPLCQIDDQTNEENDEIYMFNRVPYDFNFDLNIATVLYEDSLKIVEQIVPFFTPELTLTINDIEQFRLTTNIPITLDSVSQTVEYEGSNDNRRTILWTLGFTARGYLYSNIRDTKRIKETVMNYHNSDYESIFDRLTAEVVPREAKKSEPHVIVEKLEEIDNG